jgi:Tol biopolymer transport system component
MHRGLGLVLAISACGGGQPARPDAAIDAAPPAMRCDPAAPFHAPVPVSSLNTSLEEATPRLSNDELSIVFVRRTGGPSGNYDLYTSQRASIDQAFDPPVVIGSLNSIYSDNWPSLTPDGLTIYFQTDRVVPGTVQVWAGSRTSVTAPWGPPAQVTGFSNNDVEPLVTASGSAIYFSSSVRTGLGMGDIFRVSIDAPGVVGTPQAVLGGVNTAADEETPAVTGDELTIFFRRKTPDPDIYTASRSSINDGFGAATAVPGLAEPGVNEISSWVSPDGCHLYFFSDAAGGQGSMDIYMVTRE